MSASETQAYHVDFALHTLGWKAFQDLCAQVMEEELNSTVSVYREAQDGGQDAVFLAKSPDGLNVVGTVQCKFSSKREQRLRPSDITRAPRKTSTRPPLVKSHRSESAPSRLR